jgi:acyl-coenzyme A thioesterase 13
MGNTKLKMLQSFIGNNFTASPSPYAHWLNGKVIAASESKVVFEFVVRKEMTNPIGTLHGGVTASIIDDLIGVTIFCLDEEYFFSTVNLIVDYFSPAREGDIILAETSIIKRGKQLINAQCDIWNADKTRLIAKGYSNLLKTEIKKS